MKEYFDLYDESLYLWFSGLWDNGIGAFYYSNSARDTEWYLPDIESTVQIMRAFASLGLIPNGKMSENIPAWLRDRLVSFTRGLQEKDDGYFYMPQWGKEEITTSRRGRDLYWCVGFLEELGAEPLYPTSISSGTKKATSLPEHLSSADAFRSYLSGLDIKKMSYHYGNLLQSQAWQIKAAGDEFVDILIAWLDENHIVAVGDGEKSNSNSVAFIQLFILNNNQLGTINYKLLESNEKDSTFNSFCKVYYENGYIGVIGTTSGIMTIEDDSFWGNIFNLETEEYYVCGTVSIFSTSLQFVSGHKYFSMQSDKGKLSMFANATSLGNGTYICVGVSNYKDDSDLKNGYIQYNVDLFK